MFAQSIENSKLLWQTDLPIPTPQPHEVLIKVAYAGVNRADVYQVQGKYPPPAGASPLPGLEVSGEIVAVGAGCGVRGAVNPDLGATEQGEAAEGRGVWGVFPIQQKVCALLEGGGYAEYVTVAASQVLPVPQGWSLAEAAALPEVLFTNWLALVETAQLQPGERLLIHGGASGVGSFAIPLAKQLGATVITTTGTIEKAEFCLERGADEAINYRDQNFTDVAPVDVILDMVGGDYVTKNLKLLKRGGRLVQLAFQQSTKTEVNLAPLLFNNLRWQGVTLRSQPVERKAELARQIMAQCWPWLESGQLKPPIYAEFPLQEAAKAHEVMQQNLNLGKIVLKVAA